MGRKAFVNVHEEENFSMNLATAQWVPTDGISWDSFRMNEREKFRDHWWKFHLLLAISIEKKSSPSTICCTPCYPDIQCLLLFTLNLVHFLSLALVSRTPVEFWVELLSYSVALLLLNDIIVGDGDEQEENWASLRAILEKFFFILSHSQLYSSWYVNDEDDDDDEVNLFLRGTYVFAF